MTPTSTRGANASTSWIERTIRFCLENKLVVFLLMGFIVLWGYRVMPFRSERELIPRDPIPVDAIPDIGENQQVVFTEWPGRSPQDIENQITYPLTSALQGTAGVKTIRGTSMFGFSIVFVIFEDRYDFYWCRSRLNEKLGTVGSLLPEGVTPRMGPEGTGLGQVFWYALEGSHGGFDLEELRTIQDWDVRFLLQGVDGVAEVAGVGGYVREYQVDVDPDAMRAYGVTLPDVFTAVRQSNIDVGAESIESNGVEYVVRGKGFIRSVADLENVVLRAEDGVPTYLRNVARVQLGPAPRRGALDKEGVEAVGGVVLVRYGANPLTVIDALKQRIAEISPGLPRKTLADGTVTQVRIVPFYDRTQLIHETLDTLRHALIDETLITMFVVIVMMMHFRSAMLVCLNLPLATMGAFVLMKTFGVDSNLMSLGGIAIAIGTMVDMGIILCENMHRHFDEADPSEPTIDVIHRAASEVGSAVVTAIATTLVSFLPIFGLIGPEGKLFKPLAYTKTFALLASVVVALTILPSLAHLILRHPRSNDVPHKRIGWWMWRFALVALGVWGGLALSPAGWLLVAYAAYAAAEPFLPGRWTRFGKYAASYAAAAGILYLLTLHWMPLGLGAGVTRNLVFVFVLNGAWTALRLIFVDFYPHILRFLLRHKLIFSTIPILMVVFGLVIWFGFGKVFGFVPRAARAIGASETAIRSSAWWTASVQRFPGIGREFMPPLDEGSFLLMPTVMPHAGIGSALEVIAAQDKAIRAIPEVESVVGKIGRAESAIDPAPLSMIETVILYKTEYKHDPITGELVTDDDKKPIRQWRDHIRSPNDIWNEITKAATFPGATGAPKLQPISTRLVMLQSGMRAQMGVKVHGRSLEEIEAVGFRIADLLRTVPGIRPASVIPDRVIGKPYLEINIDRLRIARYGVSVRDVQDVIEIAVGGIPIGTTVEGRQRFPIRVRYQRELRDNIEALERILVPDMNGEQVPLAQLATVEYVRGPEEIKSEDNFLVSYVLFDKEPDRAEVNVVEQAAATLRRAVESGELTIPPGVSYTFAGAYENQVRFQRRLSVLLPLSLFLIFVILYFQFRSTGMAFLVFLGVSVGWAGGFIGLWLTAQPWFLNFEVFGRNVRDVFHLDVYNLSTAVWVGFIALFGIATDDAVVIMTYLNQLFAKTPVRGVEDIRSLVVEAGCRRVRPLLMTTTTTALALMPVLTGTGRGADVMIPMALPIFWGMTFELMTLFNAPVKYCILKECLWKWGIRKGHFVEAQ